MFEYRRDLIGSESFWRLLTQRHPEHLDLLCDIDASTAELQSIDLRLWCDVIEVSKKELRARKRLKVLAFLLMFGLSLEECRGIEIAAASFGPVYQAATGERAESLWSILRPVVGRRDTSRGGLRSSLRRAVLTPFLEGRCDPSDLFSMTNNADLFKRLLKDIPDGKQGRSFLEDLESAAKGSESKATRGQAKIIEEALRGSMFRFFWDF